MSDKFYVIELGKIPQFPRPEERINLYIWTFNHTL